jgi:hypothetical protein
MSVAFLAWRGRLVNNCSGPRTGRLANFAALIAQSNRPHPIRRAILRGNHDNRPRLRGSTRPRQATTSSKIRDVTFIALDVTFIALLDIGLVAG